MTKQSFDAQFEQLLLTHTSRLIELPNQQFEKMLEKSAVEALELFNLDRLSLYPASRPQVNLKQYITMTRAAGIPNFQLSFYEDDAESYFDSLRKLKSVTTFSADDFAKTNNAVLKRLDKEGVRWHAMIPLEIHGKLWGGLSVSSYDEKIQAPDHEQLLRLKLLCQLWVCSWRYAILSRNLSKESNEINYVIDPLAALSKRQLQVLSHLAAGRTAKQCAELLNLSHRTVETHKYRIMEAIGVKTNTELVKFAAQHDLIAD
ncbi:hypothetical protein AHAT_14400 [Agarivorans sp. Toyoura001]|uniref:response regulator transcription factor n=1 Tax=Agarivorans sp. Toyoura001 TaxID=2283141 RepID=UPI0010F20639|nr:LuxR C-terminal-related transcriptional regulator [Agarivorans sp. Toyoura001]GDY25550.1 hypothetical protein AHAT_14400 [Agarivorans sp. Toyoura001]